MILLVYGLWVLVFLHSGHTVWNFIDLGQRFKTAVHRGSTTGYDGQWSYYLAVDPTHAYIHMDSPGYRYGRILYPMLARLLAGGQAGLVPYTLAAVNLVALGAGTFAVALWLVRKSFAPWYALIYGLYPGLFTSFIRDLTEVLAYGLVAWAVFLFDFGGGRRGVFWSALLFGLAALTREITIVFAVLFGLAAVLRGPQSNERFRTAVIFYGMVLGPFIAYKVFLVAWLGSTGVTSAAYPTLLPFRGLLHGPWRVDQSYAVIAIVVPALICTAAVVAALRRGAANVAMWVLLANVLLFVVLLNAESYEDIFGSARAATGVVVAAVFCLPVLVRRIGRAWFLLTSVCWLAFAPFWFVVVPVWELHP